MAILSGIPISLLPIELTDFTYARANQTLRYADYFNVHELADKLKKQGYLMLSPFPRRKPMTLASTNRVVCSSKHMYARLTTGWLLHPPALQLGYLALLKVYASDEDRFVLYPNAVHFVGAKLDQGQMMLARWIESQGGLAPEERAERKQIDSSCFDKPEAIFDDFFKSHLLWKLQGPKTVTTEETATVKRRIELHL